MKSELIESEPVPVYAISEVENIADLAENFLDAFGAEKVVVQLEGGGKGLSFETKREQRMFGAALEYAAKNSRRQSNEDVLRWLHRWLDLQMIDPKDDYNREEMAGEKKELWASMTDEQKRQSMELADKIKAFVRK